MSGKTRNITNKINKLMDSFPIVAIIGSRQSGKTHLTKALRPDWKYIDIEDPQTFHLVDSDPKFFFEKNPQNVIIDEAQLSPKLFQVLRGVIDKNRKLNNRFLISGSSSPELLKNISESLAGRVATVELGPLKFNEFIEKPLSPFFKIFEGSDISEVIGTHYQVHSKEILDFWFHGGYPDAALAPDDMIREAWFENYIKNYVYRDVARLFPRMNQNKFQRFLLMLFKLSGTIVNKRKLAQVVEVSEPTIKEFIDIAHGTFLWRNLPSFEHNIKKEVVKMPKGHVRDSGLLHHALFFKDLDALDSHPIVGHSFESFVIEEIIKGLEAVEISAWKPYYYRTRNQAEIDLIVHGKFGVIPIEIKYGMEVSIKSLSSLRNFVKEHSLPFGILVNNSKEIDWICKEIIQIPVGFL